MDLELALGGRYDRVRPLIDGRVQVTGADLHTEIFPGPPHAFAAMADSTRFAAGEMSLAFYTTMLTTRTAESPMPFVALPVFVSRMFRRANVFVREGSPLEDLRQLAGTDVALPEYGMTMAVWIRGLLADEAGVAPADLRWHCTRPAVIPATSALEPPSGVHIVQTDGQQTPLQLLADGAVDAAIDAPPIEAHPGIRRLVRDPYRADRDRYEHDGVFPIMHVLVLRSAAVDAHPELVVALYDAFSRARDMALAELRSTAVTYASLPGLDSFVYDVWQLFDGQPWPYGVTANLRTLDTFLRYMSEQQLLGSRPVDATTLFHPLMSDT